MLAVLVCPQNPVRVVLVDPILLHVCQQVELPVRRKPGINRRSLVWRDGSPVIRDIWPRDRVILPTGEESDVRIEGNRGGVQRT